MVTEIKQEPIEHSIYFLLPVTPKPRTRLLHENKRVYIEILDSDDEQDSDGGLSTISLMCTCSDAHTNVFLDAEIPAVSQAEPCTRMLSFIIESIFFISQFLCVASSSQDGSYDLDPEYREDPGENFINSTPSSSPVALSRLGSINIGDSEHVCTEESESDFEIYSVEDDSSDSEVESVTSDAANMDVEWKDAETQWMEAHISSEVLERPSPVNRLLTVQRVEKVYGGIPSNWPIHREPTAYLIDLSDPRYLRDGRVVDPEILLSEEVSFRTEMVLLLICQFH